MIKKKLPEKEKSNAKKQRISQTDIPIYGFKECLKLAECLDREFNGEAAPHQLAVAFKMSPTSSNWRYITGAGVAYGLTDGAYNSNTLKLTSLARKIIAPTEEGEEIQAKVESALKPRIILEFFNKYNKGKFPSDQIAYNVLETMGVPRERVKNILLIIKEIGDEVGIVHQTKTGPFVAINTPITKPKADRPLDENEATGDERETSEMEKIARSISGRAVVGNTEPAKENNNKVFITHGKNRAIVDQLKELLVFGKFEPVVSVEKETLSIPVPDKVLQDMRSCSAAVIHVDGEGEVLDSHGNKHIHINSNVLIEIGAAMALYAKRFVLLVRKGVNLPSNLQGLYRCEYEGDKLDYDSTMKLLKTFNEFR